MINLPDNSDIHDAGDNHSHFEEQRSDILRNRFVLVIDDNVELLSMMGDAFRAVGAIVETAEDGLDAIRSFRVEPADLVVTDILMPTKEGIETIIEMKQRHPGVKIIAISGGGRLGSLDFLDLARQLGADSAMAKPFLLDELVEEGRALLAAA
jgi:DNA-binding response OmpR family regulator